MPSGVISPAKLFFLFVTGPIPIYTGSLSSQVTDTLRPHTVLAWLSHRVLTVSSPCAYRFLWNMDCSSKISIAALKYLLLLWNMYCRSETCIDAPKCILALRNMLSRRHAHVSKTSLYSTIWAPPHERVHNGLVPAPRPLTVLIPGSHCVPPLVSTRRKVLSMSKTFAGSRRVSPAANGPPTCSADHSTPRPVPSPCSTVRTKFTTRWHTVGLAGAMWQLH